MIKIYSCGPTVYSHPHIGNWRAYIFSDVLKKVMRYFSYEVIDVINITDVGHLVSDSDDGEDKMLKASKKENLDPYQIARKYEREFIKGLEKLHIQKPNYLPRATEHIKEQIEIIDELKQKDIAYLTDDGIYFDVSKFNDYGKLSGQKLEEKESGARVELDSQKRNPQDFALWKFLTGDNKNHIMKWDSPWGVGFPGWHIECSAMIKSILGKTIDIHGGGIDLIFPHHENEIAQGEGCNCEKYCNYWMHNEFINFNDEKMSKSLGNVITGRSFMDKYHPEVLKFLMLSAHYRSMLAMSDDKIHQAISGLRRIYETLNTVDFVLSDFEKSENGKVNKSFAQLLTQQDAKIKKSLDDDFGTGEVIASFFEVIRAFNALNILKKKKDPNSWTTANALKEWIAKYGSMMALFKEVPAKFLSDIDDIMLKEKNIDKSQVEALAKKREEAREAKDWAAADSARDELHALGIDFQDTPDGVKWNVKV